MQLPIIITMSWLGCSETGVSGGFEGGLPLDSSRHTDRFVQTATSRFDVLFVLDKSGSMVEHQDTLVANVPLLMDRFEASGSAFRIGVTTAAPEVGGPLIEAADKRWIDAGDPDVEARFEAMAVGIGGGTPEKGLAAAYRALGELNETENAGFRRDDAALHTIVISNEHDYSSDVIRLDDFVTWYDGLARSPDERTFSAVDVLSAGNSGPGGKPYRNVTREIGGVVESIHSPGWERALQTFGVRTLDLQTDFFLSQTPVPSSIVVELSTNAGWSDVPPAGFDGDQGWRGWVYDGSRNAVQLENLWPDAGVVIAVSYTVATPPG